MQSTNPAGCTPELLNVKEACAILGVKRTKLEELASQGCFAKVKLGERCVRFTRSSILRFIQELEDGGGCA